LSAQVLDAAHRAAFLARWKINDGFGSFILFHLYETNIISDARLNANVPGYSTSSRSE
jgi:hypothetical protein